MGIRASWDYVERSPSSRDRIFRERRLWIGHATGAKNCFGGDQWPRRDHRQQRIPRAEDAREVREDALFS